LVALAELPDRFGELVQSLPETLVRQLTARPTRELVEVDAEGARDLRIVRIHCTNYIEVGADEGSTSVLHGSLDSGSAKK
jgi:hypothetical protein